MMIFSFFFRAEDGIRDIGVTGVQTCALPICRAALRARQKIVLTRAVTAPDQPGKHRAGEIACDELLFDKLRRLRKQLADERGVPPYIVFSDVSLRQMARNYPQDEKAFSRVSG